MDVRKESIVSALVVGGIAAVVIQFALDKTADRIAKLELSEETVWVGVTPVEESLQVFVRNDSDEALDLINLEISVDAEKKSKRLGAYPEPSRTYTINMDGNKYNAQSSQQGLFLKASILQAIEPKESDSFSIAFENANDFDIKGYTIDFIDKNGMRFSTNYIPE